MGKEGSFSTIGWKFHQIGYPLGGEVVSSNNGETKDTWFVDFWKELVGILM